MQETIENFSEQLRELCHQYNVFFETPVRVVEIDDTFESVSMEVLEELPCYGGKDTRGPFIKFSYSKLPTQEQHFELGKSADIVSDRMLVRKKIPDGFKDVMNSMKKMKGSQIEGF